MNFMEGVIPLATDRFWSLLSIIPGFSLKIVAELNESLGNWR